MTLSTNSRPAVLQGDDYSHDHPQGSNRGYDHPSLLVLLWIEAVDNGNCYSGTLSANRDRRLRFGEVMNLLHLRTRLGAQLDKNTVIFHNKAAIYQEGTSYNALKKNRGGRRQSKEPKTGASASSSPCCSSSSDSPKRFDALLIIRPKGHARVRAKGGERVRLVF